MSFSRAQQPEFRQLVKRAWAAVCPLLGLLPKDEEAQRAWYEQELAEATGKRSSTECNVKEDYEAAMAHFECLAGDGIRWQMRQARGKANRILHEVRKLAAAWDCDEEYMLGIASQALRRSVVAWEDLGPEALLTILRALKIQVRRQLNRGEAADRPRTRVRKGDPF